MSFFKAPSWSKPQAIEKDEAERDMFSHASKFLDIQQDTIEHKKKIAERRKQKELEREQRKQAKADKKERKDAIKRESPGQDSKKDLKRRRINSEESKKLLALVMPITIDSDDDDDEATSEPVSLPVRRSPRGQKIQDVTLSPRKPKSRLSRKVDLDDDSDNDARVKAARSKPTPAAEPIEEEDSDPEIAAIKRRAREKHKLRQQQEGSSTPGAVHSEGDVEAGPTHTGLPTPPLVDPIIAVLISSDLPDTTPLLVKRKLSQTLQQVREAWCQKQIQNGYGEDLVDKVFLTWRGRRLYNFTTCQRLGLEVDSHGNVVRADERDKDGAAKVHVIATTDELYAQSKVGKEREAKENGGQQEEVEEEVEEQPAGEQQQRPEKRQIHLFIKAKYRKDVRVLVTPVTMVSKVLRFAKRQHGIPDDQPAYLQFDGERLDPDEPVSSAELEDMDGVDLLLGE